MSVLEFARPTTIALTVLLLMVGCVSEQKYDTLQARYNQLQ